MAVDGALAAFRMCRRKCSRRAEDARQHARPVLRDVQHDEDGCRQIVGKVGDQLRERFDAARRCSDHEEIAGRHVRERTPQNPVRRPRTLRIATYGTPHLLAYARRRGVLPIA